MTTTTQTTPAPKSKLLPIGILFMVVGLFGRQPLLSAVRAMHPPSPAGLSLAQRIGLVVATDGLTLLFMAGVICALLGWLRNNRASRAAQK